MAREVRELPVLEGKAARDFYKQWAKAKDDTSKEDVQESRRKSKAILTKYYKQLYNL